MAVSAFRSLVKIIPDSVWDAVTRLADRRTPLSRLMNQRVLAGAELPAVARARTDATHRVLIAPFNYAGQAHQWARTAAEHHDTEAVNLTVDAPGGLGFASDYRVPAQVFMGSWQWRENQGAALTSFTHLMIESFMSPLGSGRGRTLRKQIEGWQKQGINVAFVCHGSDIRSPHGHRLRHTHSPFRNDAESRRLERRIRKNQALIRELQIPVYVSTPDLLDDVPTATWLPLVIDPTVWGAVAEEHPILTHDAQPIIAHAFTSATLKGSEHVARAATALQDLATYQPIQGVQATDMPATIGQADIVVDQLLIGSYGVAACEAMAAGRVVVGNVTKPIRQRITQEFGLELPIVQATPDTITEVLSELLRNQERMHAIAQAGQEFVQRVHTGSQTAPQLARFLSS